jgi:hypothetical protein
MATYIRPRGQEVAANPSDVCVAWGRVNPVDVRDGLDPAARQLLSAAVRGELLEIAARHHDERRTSLS